MHAALADPARLHIIDTLGASDTSPSELAAMLAMPSNLLAHHLHVLEQAGLLTRRRSDGDRRRTYLQLIPGALESLTRPAARTAGRVLFVCTANSARSHLAAALWRRASTVPAASAGTQPAARVDPGAIAAARRHHLPMRRLRPCHIGDVRQDGDLIITVCDLAREELGREAAVHWSVPDPVPAGDPASFDAALAELSDRAGASRRAWQPADLVHTPAAWAGMGYGRVARITAACTPSPTAANASGSQSVTVSPSRAARARPAYRALTASRIWSRSAGWRAGAMVILRECQRQPRAGRVRVCPSPGPRQWESSPRSCR